MKKILKILKIFKIQYFLNYSIIINLNINFKNIKKKKNKLKKKKNNIFITCLLIKNALLILISKSIIFKGYSKIIEFLIIFIYL
jgi:hypothetical protein